MESYLPIMVLAIALLTSSTVAAFNQQSNPQRFKLRYTAGLPLHPVPFNEHMAAAEFGGRLGSSSVKTYSTAVHNSFLTGTRKLLRNGPGPGLGSDSRSSVEQRLQQVRLTPQVSATYAKVAGDVVKIDKRRFGSPEVDLLPNTANAAGDVNTAGVRKLQASDPAGREIMLTGSRKLLSNGPGLGSDRSSVEQRLERMRIEPRATAAAVKVADPATVDERRFGSPGV